MGSPVSRPRLSEAESSAQVTQQPAESRCLAAATAAGTACARARGARGTPARGLRAGSRGAGDGWGRMAGGAEGPRGARGGDRGQGVRSAPPHPSSRPARAGGGPAAAAAHASCGRGGCRRGAARRSRAAEPGAPSEPRVGPATGPRRRRAAAPRAAPREQRRPPPAAAAMKPGPPHRAGAAHGAGAGAGAAAGPGARGLLLPPLLLLLLAGRAAGVSDARRDPRPGTPRHPLVPSPTASLAPPRGRPPEMASVGEGHPRRWGAFGGSRFSSFWDPSLDGGRAGTSAAPPPRQLRESASPPAERGSLFWVRGAGRA